MGRASNATRPTATSAEVRRRLAELGDGRRERLEGWGYPVADLDEWAARGDTEADQVDALLAIMLNRTEYTYDLDDVRGAEKIAKKLGATLTPRAHLISRGAVFRGGNVRGYRKPGEKNLTPRAVYGIFGGVFLLIVLAGVIVSALR